ncbi:hypothetical protein Ahy_B04g071650 [Arachis hypogaea]|uniref:Uncharacterized protein n=1 Tax=Arachis hypogaea TaxID=3818 RepID=A0A444ZL78_ARAHY|nr:hypothetical protein Ahy_B04g071650 [Arachis hypogaea]
MKGLKKLMLSLMTITSINWLAWSMIFMYISDWMGRKVYGENLGIKVDTMYDTGYRIKQVTKYQENTRKDAGICIASCTTKAKWISTAMEATMNNFQTRHGCAGGDLDFGCAGADPDSSYASLITM